MSPTPRFRPVYWLAGLTLALAVLSLAAAGCSEREPTPELAEVESLSTADLGQLGGRIYNEPERASEILEEAGLTAEEFEARVRQVTDDPELSIEYTRAFETVAGASVVEEDAAPEVLDSVPGGGP